jgi:cytochrome c oxidase subunit 1
MATTTVEISDFPAGPRSFTLRLHDWVTTVDHKRLGILYVLYALIFLVLGGIEATIMRLQLLRALEWTPFLRQPVNP